MSRFTRFDGAKPSFVGFYRVLMGLYDFDWVWPRLSGLSWVGAGLTEHHWT